MAEFSIDPWGDDRADLRQAITSTVMANSHAAKGKTYKVKDFMPDFDKQTKRQTPGQMATVLKAMAGAMAAKEQLKRDG